MNLNAKVLTLVSDSIDYRVITDSYNRKYTVVINYERKQEAFNVCD